MGLETKIKGLISFRAKESQGQATRVAPPRPAPVLTLPQEMAPSPLANLQVIASASAPPQPAAPAPETPTAPTPPEERKNVGDQLLKLFTSEDAEESPLGNLMASLAEVDATDLLAECQEVKGRLCRR